jgi:2-polyprenyl-6-hydroxyphenyl methylase/3-demethylubiquinone-9 3-methyltransferase
MPADNELYNRLSTTWWDENEPLGLLRTWLGPVRAGYFREVLLERCLRIPQKCKVLDIGCGGGLLTEEFARLGCLVTGIDPSEASLATAKKHAGQAGLEITYLAGVGEQLPFANTSFDVVTCCDVLEHAVSVPQILQEISRVLTTSGIFFYDTVNRTILTWLIAIQIAQNWKVTRFLPPNLHDWHQFIKPNELVGYMKIFGLHNQELKGINPRAHPLLALAQFLRYKRGQITLTQLGAFFDFHASKDLSGLYMGYALK